VYGVHPCGRFSTARFGYPCPSLPHRGQSHPPQVRHCHHPRGGRAALSLADQDCSHEIHSRRFPVGTVLLTVTRPFAVGSSFPVTVVLPVWSPYDLLMSCNSLRPPVSFCWLRGGCVAMPRAASFCTRRPHNHSGFPRFRIVEGTLNLRVVGSIPTRLTTDSARLSRLSSDPLTASGCAGVADSCASSSRATSFRAATSGNQCACSF